MLAGIVLFAFGLKTTLHDVNAALDDVAAVALCGGAGLCLLSHVASSCARPVASSGGGRSAAPSSSLSFPLRSRCPRSQL